MRQLDFPRLWSDQKHCRDHNSDADQHSADNARQEIALLRHHQWLVQFHFLGIASLYSQRPAPSICLTRALSGRRRIAFGCAEFLVSPALLRKGSCLAWETASLTADLMAGARMRTSRIAFLWACGGFPSSIWRGDRSRSTTKTARWRSALTAKSTTTSSSTINWFRKGHSFRTRSDTEVIVHAYEEWGKECVKQFNGMFAFALHDSRTGETFFARDRCGQKPFYYHQSNGRFVFASEVKAILECGQVPRACNIPAIDAYLALRYVPEPRTMFEGIFTLPAAHTLLLKSDGCGGDRALLGRPDFSWRISDRLRACSMRPRPCFATRCGLPCAATFPSVAI